MVARRIPVPKVACSNHVRVIFLKHLWGSGNLIDYQSIASRSIRDGCSVRGVMVTYLPSKQVPRVRFPADVYLYIFDLGF